jgi:uncharacterized protein (DUF934 family)
VPPELIHAVPPRVAPDPWRLLEDAPTGLPRGPIVVPLRAWQERRDELARRREPFGVWLAPEDEPESLAEGFRDLSLIAVRFPKSADGRGYSTGVLLRRLGYRGPLRAFGDIGRDQLLFLRRCGFDTFVLPPGRDPHAALGALEEFSAHYQGSIDDPRPLFRRRAAAHG